MRSAYPNSTHSLTSNGLFKYKLHHLPFWFGYHFLWWTLRIGSPLDVVNSLFLPHAAAKFLSYLIFQMIGVYFNLYFLIPVFLERGRYIVYIVSLLVTIIVTSCCIVSGYYIGALLSDKPFQELFGVDPSKPFFLFESGALPSTLAAMTLAMSIKLTKNWIQTKRKEQALEKEKLETELKFLRAQFNPHFLFNTINSIFVLIHKNPSMASGALAKFSDLLRYQLYECNENEISVKQELNYLESFIELERLRLDSQTVSLTLELEHQYDYNLNIAPFILMPFIENTFKHVSQWKDRPNWIKIILKFDQHQLYFEVANSTSADPASLRELTQYKGLGLKNVQRRLDLLYPGDHTLVINQDTDSFRIMLHLTLREHVMAERLTSNAQ